MDESCVVTSTTQNSNLTPSIPLPGAVQTLIKGTLVGRHNLAEDVCADGVQLGTGRDTYSRAGYSHIDVEVSYIGLDKPVDVILNPLD